MIAMLGYMLFCVVLFVAGKFEMLSVPWIPWMVLAACGYLVGLKVRRKKDGNVVYGTMGRNRFGAAFLRGPFGLIAMSNLLLVRVLSTDCPTVLYSDNVALSGTNGINVWDESCTIGSDITLLSGKTAKIKKISSMSGELVLDREATNLANGRHFNVYGALEIEGVTLTK